MSAHHPAPLHASKPETPTVQATKPASEIPAPAPVVATPVAVPEPNTNTRFSTLFTVALVIASTLPVGIGVGAACRPKPIVTSPAHHKHDESLDHQDLPTAKAVMESRQKADDLFQAGEIELALQLYQSKESAKSLRPSDRLSFKIALCHESLGQWDEALATYHVLASRDDLPLRAAALLAQGRVWLSRHDRDKAQAVLDEFLRMSQESEVVPVAMIQDAQFLAAITGLLNSSEMEFVPDGLHPIPPLHDMAWPFVRAFEQISQIAEPPVAELARVQTQNLATLATDTSPSADSPSVQQLLEAAPRHWLAGRLKLAVAHAAEQRQQLSEAAAGYDELLGRSSSTVSVIAAYNGGLIQFQLREYRFASVALGRVADGAPGQKLAILALILRGRALLEIGDYEPAMFDLKRAADLHGNPDDLAWATALAGMAALRMQKPQLAGELMFQRRDRLQNSPADKAAAFVISLARYQSLASPEARDREGLFLLRALAALDLDDRHASTTLGSCGPVLIGQAYRDLGLVEQMVEVYSHALSQDSREPFASEMKFALAEHAVLSGDPQQGVADLTALHANPHNPWSVRAGLRMAAWELSQDHSTECLALCRELLKRDTDHSPILRLMGSAYERIGDYANAAECFAGVAPQ